MSLKFGEYSPASFLMIQEGDNLDAYVKLPNGKRINVWHFAEHDRYLWDRKQEPLLFANTTREDYFKKLFGKDWANILFMENEFHNKFVINNDEVGDLAKINGGDYGVRFAGIDDEGFYIFDAHTYYHGQDAGAYNYSAKVKPAIHIESWKPITLFDKERYSSF